MSLVIVILAVICTLALAVCSVRRSDSGVVLEYDTSAALKGAAILMVFVHHYGQLSSETYNAHSFLGFVGVTIFMFVSGYVSQKQLLKKGRSYLGVSFLVKKFIRLYIPYILIAGSFSIVAGNGIKGTLIKLINIQSDWFLTAITIIFLMFFIVNSFVLIHSEHNEKSEWGGQSVVCMTVAVVMYIIVCVILPLSSSVWYSTVLAFPVGAYAALLELYKDQGKDMKYGIPESTGVKVIVTLISAACLILSICRIFPYNLMSTLTSLGLSLMMLLMMGSISIKSKPLAFIGAFSWEFYLCQSKILVKVGDKLGGNALVWFVVALICAMIVGYVVHKIMDLPKHIRTNKRQ